MTILMVLVPSTLEAKIWIFFVVMNPFVVQISDGNYIYLQVWVWLQIIGNLMCVKV